MESGGSNNLGLKKKNGKITNRKQQLGLMKDLVTKGWKTENRFKPGYLLKLEAGMLKMLPGTDIRVNPHITSRVTIWRKKSWISSNNVEPQFWNWV
ncbi:hypothetical protein ACS0TY_022525 [Phlomoides rotata]